jgi:hypothetical protein
MGRFYATMRGRSPCLGRFLVLVVAFRKGAALGTTWDDVNPDHQELTVNMRLQRVSRRDRGLRGNAMHCPTSA